MDSSNSFASPAKPFDIINQYLQHPTQLTSSQLAQLDHATKLSRINYSEGDIRCEYDQAINMTLKLLDSLELYFLLSPAQAERKINRIIARYKLALGEVEKFESSFEFENLSQVQFEKILNERKKLYNVLLGEINRVRQAKRLTFSQ